MYKFKLIEHNKIPWGKIESCHDHIIYKSKAWVEHLANNYNVVPYVLEVSNEDKVIGYFIGEKFKRIVSIIAAPFEGWQTPFQGLSIFESITVNQRIEIYNSLIEFLFKNKECSFFQVTDLQLEVPHVAHSDLIYQINASYILDLEPSIEEIFENMGRSAKKQIKRSAKREIIIRNPENIENYITTYYDQLNDVFYKKQLTPTRSIKEIRSQIYAMMQVNNILLLEAVLPDNSSLASLFVIYNNKIAFGLGAASYKRYNHLCPTEPLMFEAIKQLKEIGITKLDLGGRSRYKEKYGPIPYVKPKIIAARYKGLIELKQIAKKSYYSLRNLAAKIKL